MGLRRFVDHRLEGGKLSGATVDLDPAVSDRRRSCCAPSGPYVLETESEARQFMRSLGGQEDA